MSVLQSYTINTHKITRRPFEHYTGVPSASGFTLDPTRTLALNYINPSNTLPDSDSEAALSALILARRQFIEFTSLVQTPINVNINKAPRSPLNWSVTYLFPSGTVSDYVSAGFVSQIDEFARDAVGILSWSISADVTYKHYGKVESGTPVIKGYHFGDVSCRISATTDFEINDFEDIDSIPTEGLLLNINQHTVVANVEKTEDSSLAPTYRYDWSFGVL